MKPVFNKFGDFGSKAKQDHTVFASYSLNDLLKAMALGIILKEDTRNVLHIQSNNLDGRITLMETEDDYLQNIARLFRQIYNENGYSLRYSRGKTHIQEPKATLNLLSGIFNPKLNVKPIRVITALRLIEKLKIGTGIGYSSYGLLPFSEYTNQVSVVKAFDCVVDDFAGINLLQMKNTHANLCHSIEPFILLKDEINKHADGLWVELKDLIDRMLKSTDHYEFVNLGLVLIGKVEPFIDPLMQTSQPEPTLFEDEYSSSLTPVDTNSIYNQSLMGKFKLDCHCHSGTNDWKELILPMIINQIFKMKAL